MNKFIKYKTSKLIEEGLLSIGDGYRAKNAELTDNGIPFVRISNINYEIDFKSTDKFPVESIKKVGQKISKPGDVVFSSKGTIGKFIFVEDETPRFIYSPQLCYWRSLKDSFLLPKYLYYWMQSKEFFQQVNMVKGQTDMADYVSLTDQRKMTISIPALHNQKTIVEVLSSIDDKIELNHRMNQSLEDIAMALYKHWFIEKDEKHAENIKNVTIEQFATIIGGGTPKTSVEEYWNGNIPWISVKDLSSSVIIKTEKQITQLGLEKSSTKVIPKFSTVLSARGTIGNISLLGVDMAMNQSCYAIKPNKEHSVYTYISLKNEIKTLLNKSHGSVFNTITMSTLKSLEFPYSKSLCDTYEKKVSPMFQQILLNKVEIEELTSLRSYLLPKLVSGEIKLKEVEKQIEEVL